MTPSHTGRALLQPMLPQQHLVDCCPARRHVVSYDGPYLANVSQERVGRWLGELIDLSGPVGPTARDAGVWAQEMTPARPGSTRGLSSLAADRAKAVPKRVM